MSRSFRRKSRVFMVKELADYYGLHRHTVRKVIKGCDMFTVEGSIEAIRRLDAYGANERQGG